MEESGVVKYDIGDKGSTAKAPLVDGIDQLNFNFYNMDRPCRSCKKFWREWGVADDMHHTGRKRCFSKDEKEECRWWYGCRGGQLSMTSTPHKLPSKCNSYSEGGEVMAFVDFKDASEEQLREEIEKIRAGRRGVGKKKRTESKERRVSGGQTSKPKDIVRL